MYVHLCRCPYMYVFLLLLEEDKIMKKKSSQSHFKISRDNPVLSA